MNPNFISIENSEYGVLEFTQGSGGKFVSKEEFVNNTAIPMCWAGAFQKEYYDICKRNNLKFYNFDSGYFGNRKTKIWLRITVNNFQNTNEIINRPSDRWNHLGIVLDDFKQGKKIVIVPPDRKIAGMQKLGTSEEWTRKIIQEIKKYSDREILIRNRPVKRTTRLLTDTFKNFIRDETWCVVGYSSNALVEAAMNNIPVIALGNSATNSLYKTPISKIESIKPADKLIRQQWLNHLSYCQFTRDELQSGLAWKLLNS